MKASLIQELNHILKYGRIPVIHMYYMGKPSTYHFKIVELNIIEYDPTWDLRFHKGALFIKKISQSGDLVLDRDLIIPPKRKVVVEEEMYIFEADEMEELLLALEDRLKMPMPPELWDHVFRITWSITPS